MTHHSPGLRLLRRVARTLILALALLVVAAPFNPGFSPLPLLAQPHPASYQQAPHQLAPHQPAPLQPTPNQPAGLLPAIQLNLVVEGLDDPVLVTHAGDGSDRLFIVERKGIVRIFKNGALLPTPFLDIVDRVQAGGCGECGLLGLAFPPDFADSGLFYASYTAKDDLIQPTDPDEPNDGSDSVVARFALTTNPDVADPDSEEHILLVNQPAGNHNGGMITFGPDGYFYFGLGDGGGSNDPRDVARNPGSLLGKMLRIEVGATGTYTVPVDNPFVGQAAYRPEIWAMGLRNPWRYSFDRSTGDLFIADVGQGDREEVNFQPNDDAGGQDYGWDVMEGFSCFDDPGENDDGPPCNQNGLTLPIHDYSHSFGESITGGYVYRGPHLALQGIYIYGDFGSGRIWGLRRPAAEWLNDQFLDTGFLISSFGEDEDGNVYLVHYGGKVYRIDTQPLILDFRSFIPIQRQ